MESRSGTDSNLLLSETPGAWERLLEALGLPALLVLIEERMGSDLRQRYAPEDVLQEGLLHAWRDRAKLEWRGIAPFRRWFLRVLENRLCDLADGVGALKRGSGQAPVPLDPRTDSSGAAVPEHVLAVTTTPDRLAMLKEQAAVLRDALRSLPDDLRPVVRLRVLEEKSSQEVADELGIGVSAVKHRLRSGAALLRARLREEHSKRGAGR